MNIEQSVDYILGRKEIIADLFYEIFLDRYPEVQEFFTDVNLEHQSALLTMALATIQQHYQRNYPATEHYLKVLGSRHHNWGIPPKLYSHFCECMLQTLERFHGSNWSEALATQWREAIDHASGTMLEGYEHNYVY